MGGMENILNTMITRILDISKIESDKLNLSLERIDIIPIVLNQAENFRILAKEKNIIIEVKMNYKSIMLVLDNNYFIQILNNLISNAVKFSKQGDEITISISKSSSTIIEIKDTGQGISKEDQKKLFSKFQKLTAQPTGGEESTGLGLSIVKKYVDAMNGKIWCESELDKGASFFLEF